jgi:cytochrome c-type biogenesis protein CcmE
MKARTKFLIGGAIVLGTATFLMWTSVANTMTYMLTPGELHARVRADSTFARHSVQVGAIAVPGTIVREAGGRVHRFLAAYQGDTLRVVYNGIAPDTFTDGVDIVVAGKLRRDGTFEATTLLAKCASRYENAPGTTAPKKIASASRGP